MTREYIKINDFNLFYDLVKVLTKMSDGVKFTINDVGVTVYAKNDYSKCEMTSNSITLPSETSFCIGELDTFLKILTTLKELYKNGGIEGVKMYYDKPFLRIESKKFRTKLATVEESRISNFIATKVHTELTPQLEFTTSSDVIKSINSHSFIFNDSSTPRVYLSTDPEMENNVIFATIGNKKNDLANSLTLEMGLITYGTTDERELILDFNRLNILNAINSDEIKVSLAKERPVLISKVQKNGNNGTFFKFDVYVFLMVK